MATAVSRALWLFNEASSGTTPTQVLDSSGSGNHLDIDYSSGDASWTSIAAGSGLNFSASAVAANTARLRLSPISTRGNLATTVFNNATELSFIIVGNFTTPASGGVSYLCRMGSDLASGGSFHMSLNSDRRISVRWGREFDSYSSNYFGTTIGTGVRVIVLRIDTTQATDTNRVVIWDNGTQLASHVEDVVEIPQNSALPTDTSDQYWTVGNRETGESNVLGPIYYSQLYSGSLTSTQAGNASTALQANNDADWSAADTTPPTFTVGPGVTPSSSGGTATGTIDETGSIFYVIVADGASAPSSAQVIAGQNASGAAALASGNATATTTINSGFSGLSASTPYDAYFVARDDEGTPNVQASPTLVNFTTSAPAGTKLLLQLMNS